MIGLRAAHEIRHPVAEPGDLWVLGRDRLLCGDSTVATDVARVLGGVAPHLMVTDPNRATGRVRQVKAWGAHRRGADTSDTCSVIDRLAHA